MKRMAEALRSQGASQAEVAHLVGYEGGLGRFWSECADPTLLMRIASILGLDPKVSVRIAIEAAKAVAFYVGPKEPRPGQAVAIAQRFVDGKAKAEECTRAGQSAEEVSRAYRESKSQTKIQKRAFRAASHASLAAARAAFVARDAALTMELEYDTDYTFEDAWDGARVSCALGAAQALLEAVEAGLSAESAKATVETGSAVAGGAASQEARPFALVWAASIIRARVKDSGLDPAKYAV
jgi:hypothetical protein